MLKKPVLALFGLLISSFCLGQSRWDDSLRMEAGLQFQLAREEYMPLLLMANRYGTVADQGSDLQLSFRAQNSHTLAQIKEKPLMLEYGLSLYANQYFDHLFA